MSSYCKNCYDLIKLLNHLKSENDSLKSELMQTNCYLEADKEIIDQLKAKNTCLKKCNERLLQAIIKDQAEIVQKNIDKQIYHYLEKIWICKDSSTNSK